MTHIPRHLAVLVVCASGIAPAAAQAQYYSAGAGQPAPLYPYELQPGQPYAVRVAPNTYVIRRPGAARNYPYVRSAPAPKRFDRPPKPNDPALIDELRRRSAKKKTKGDVTREVINTTRIVRAPPVVIERRRVVEHPPRVIERYVQETPAEPPAARRGKVQVEERGVLLRAPAKRGSKGDEQRVIRADAEVTILGPDRMSIRLFRKGMGPNASIPDKP